MPAQNARKHSPKTQPKQIQSVATPLRTEYAGPAFHHSPAPSSLPPPPFLGIPKSRPQRKENSRLDAEITLDGTNSSPLGFLFDAKAREDSMNKLRGEAPPTLSFSYGGEHTDKSRAQIPRSMSNEGRIAAEPRERPIDRAVQASNTKSDIPKELATPSKSSPWAPITKVTSSPISSLATAVESSPKDVKPRTPRQSSTKTTESGSRRPARTVDGEKRALSHKQSVDTLRKPRSSKKAAPAPVVPKAILKRPVVEQPAPTQKEQAEKVSTSTHETLASTFRALQRRPKETSTNKSTRTTPASRIEDESQQDESEQDLRRQTAHLMSILNIQTTSPRESSPARQYTTTSANHDSSKVETDLRRLLNMTA